MQSCRQLEEQFPAQKLESEVRAQPPFQYSTSFVVQTRV